MKPLSKRDKASIEAQKEKPTFLALLSDVEPCPFCGKNDIYLTKVNDASFHVKCAYGCCSSRGAYNPYDGYSQERLIEVSIENWNRRPEPAPEQDKLVLAYLDLIVGMSPPYGGDEYSIFCGNQWNEDWRWDIDKLKKLSDIELLNLYKKYKDYHG